MKNYFKIALIAAIILTGCATEPVRESYFLKGPSYDIAGTRYTALISVADAYGLKTDWDSIARRLILYRGKDEMVFCVGSDIALVNNTPKQLGRPVVMHQGAVVIPEDFVLTEITKVFSAPKLRGKRTLASQPAIHKIKKIVIDPGHGGKDPGAIGNGLVEKEVALDIAQRIKSYLENSGIEAVLTRDSDRFVSLWKRADIANSESANFFISLHANACRSKYINGFEVFYLSEAIDDDARAIAAAENTALKYESSSFGDRRPSSTLEAMLKDIENTENRIESIELAKQITSTSCKKLGLKDRGIKAAKFYVLKGAQMPSVLIEVGFVSSVQDAQKLKSSQYREMLAKAIAAGIIAYQANYEKTDGFTR